MEIDMPWVFANPNEEGRAAIRMINDSGIRYHLSGISQRDLMPFVIFRSDRYYGINGIKDFIEIYQ